MNERAIGRRWIIIYHPDLKEPRRFVTEDDLRIGDPVYFAGRGKFVVSRIEEVVTESGDLELYYHAEAEL